MAEKIGRIPATPPETIEAMQAQRKEGKTPEEISAFFHVSLPTVHKYTNIVLKPEPPPQETSPQEVEVKPQPQEKPPPTRKKEYKEKDLEKKAIDASLEKQAGLPTAKTLMESAEEAGKEWAVNCQALGQYVLEVLGPMALRLNMDNKDFLTHVYQFWLNNYVEAQNKDDRIAELEVLTRRLQDFMDEDILRLYVARSIDRISVAALMGGGTLDFDTIQAYKKMLEQDIDISILKLKEEMINEAITA